MRQTLVRTAATAAGVALGLLISVISNGNSDKFDWRAQELTQWCDYYHNVAEMTLQEIRHLGAVSTTSERALVAEWNLRIGSTGRWFARCSALSPSVSIGNLDEVAPFVDYLKEIIRQSPYRSWRDPEQYVWLVNDPVVVDYFF
jgi:hypothetical protein